MDLFFFIFLLSSIGRGAPRGPAGPPGAAATPHGHTSVRCTHGGIVLLSQVENVFLRQSWTKYLEQTHFCPKSLFFFTIFQYILSEIV